jgi:hypothetical protein
MGHYELGRVSGASELRGGDKGAAANFPSWAPCEAGTEGRKERKKVCLKGKGFKQMKFKFKFEFHQTNLLHQHVCNEHQTIYLFSKNN